MIWDCLRVQWMGKWLGTSAVSREDMRLIQQGDTDNSPWVQVRRWKTFWQRGQWWSCSNQVQKAKPRGPAIDCNTTEYRFPIWCLQSDKREHDPEHKQDNLHHLSRSGSKIDCLWTVPTRLKIYVYNSGFLLRTNYAPQGVSGRNRSAKLENIMIPYLFIYIYFFRNTTDAGRLCHTFVSSSSSHHLVHDGNGFSTQTSVCLRS